MNVRRLRRKMNKLSQKDMNIFNKPATSFRMKPPQLSPPLTTRDRMYIDDLRIVSQTNTSEGLDF